MLHDNAARATRAAAQRSPRKDRLGGAIDPTLNTQPNNSATFMGSSRCEARSRDYTSILWGRYCERLRTAQHSGLADDCADATAAWKRFLAAFIPDALEREVIPS